MSSESCAVGVDVSTQTNDRSSIGSQSETSRPRPTVVLRATTQKWRSPCGTDGATAFPGLPKAALRSRATHYFYCRYGLNTPYIYSKLHPDWTTLRSFPGILIMYHNYCFRPGPCCQLLDKFTALPQIPYILASRNFFQKRYHFKNHIETTLKLWLID